MYQIAILTILQTMPPSVNHDLPRRQDVIGVVRYYESEVAYYRAHRNLNPRSAALRAMAEYREWGEKYLLGYTERLNRAVEELYRLSRKWGGVRGA